MQPEREWFDKDYYAALGVASSADGKAITKAYRKLAKQFHPDANQGSEAAEARFKEISAAYDVLSDPEKRQSYDEVRRMVAQGYGPQHGAPGSRGGGGAPGGFGAGPGGFTFEGGDAGGLGDFISGLFGGGAGGGGRRQARGGGARMARRGGDIEAETTLRFEDAVRGMTATLVLQSEVECSTCHGSGAKPGSPTPPCSHCGGSGEVLMPQGPFSVPSVCPACQGRGQNITHPCATCFGRGTARASRDVKVRIPPGVMHGQRIRVPGKGEPGASGGPAGDLFVVVNVGSHPRFTRKGKTDLTVTVPISVTQALLGGEASVPTLDGDLKVRVKPGTHTGSTVRVKGRGVHPKSGEPGALLVTFDVAIPKHLTDEERTLIEELAHRVPALARVDGVKG